MWSLWNGVGSANQRWLLYSTNSRYYQIVSAHSGLVVEIQGASLDNGGKVLQWESSGGAHQQWGVQAP